MARKTKAPKAKPEGVESKAKQKMYTIQLRPAGFDKSIFINVTDKQMQFFINQIIWEMEKPTRDNLTLYFTHIIKK